MGGESRGLSRKQIPEQPIDVATAGIYVSLEQLDCLAVVAYCDYGCGGTVIRCTIHPEGCLQWHSVIRGPCAFFDRSLEN